MRRRLLAARAGRLAPFSSAAAPSLSRRTPASHMAASPTRTYWKVWNGVMTRNTQVEQIASAVHSEAGHSILAYFPRALSRLWRFGEFFEVFRRLFVVICVPSPWSSVPERTPARECWNPVSLPPPDSPRRKFSVALQARKNPNKHGPSRTNLRTARPQRRPKILSLRPLLSKPPDYADLVQNL
jgi:hypothetical protein